MLVRSGAPVHVIFVIFSFPWNSVIKFFGVLKSEEVGREREIQQGTPSAGHHIGIRTFLSLSLFPLIRENFRSHNRSA